MNGYFLVGKENPYADSGYGYSTGKAGFDYDYQEPYFEPANEEEALLLQLSTTLAVTTIPREELE